MNELLGRWISGDAAAAEELWKTYFDRVKGFLVHLGERNPDADDLAQEAMLAGLEGIQGGTRPDRLTHWLLGIARHVRSKKTRVEWMELKDQLGPAPSGRTQALKGEMGALLDETLKGMAEKDREVLRLLHKEGLSRKEIADRMDTPVEALHARIERAYERMRRALSRHFTTVALGGIEPPPVTLDQVRKLRPTFREAVTARHLEGLSETEAAARLKIPLETLRVRLQSAYELLKRRETPDFRAAREEYRREKGN